MSDIEHSDEDETARSWVEDMLGRSPEAETIITAIEGSDRRVARLEAQLAGAVEAAVQSARDVLSLAETAGMPDSYRETDSRMARARETLSRFEGQ